MKLDGLSKEHLLEVYLPPYEELKEDSQIYALLSFSNEQEAIRYYINNNDLKLLNP